MTTILYVTSSDTPLFDPASTVHVLQYLQQNEPVLLLNQTDKAYPLVLTAAGLVGEVDVDFLTKERRQEP